MNDDVSKYPNVIMIIIIMLSDIDWLFWPMVSS